MMGLGEAFTNTAMSTSSGMSNSRIKTEKPMSVTRPRRDSHRRVFRMATTDARSPEARLNQIEYEYVRHVVDRRRGIAQII